MSLIAKKWTIVISFLVHIIFLLSIFDIYFKSPLTLGQKPVPNQIPALAKRLILFVGDGLRSDSFFDVSNGKTTSPYLRQIIEKRGRWGISHSAVPTESRPGHVALIAGFYEDPSAIFKGWKDNPVEFDSVFNQSGRTFGWGSPDVLLMFNKESSKNRIFMHTYPPSFQEFTGTKNSAARLSLWAFENFKQFLQNAKSNQPLYNMLQEDKIIFFLHLLGIDTAGHSHKPHSDVYKENVRIADQIVKDVEKLIEEFYNDDQSVFIYTSDHGMTDWGSHGEGSPNEIELPYVVWGSGTLKPSVIRGDHSPANWNVNHLERDDINQIDITPLMSILLGLSIPVNSVGTVPVKILNCNKADESSALLLNARQMLAQVIQKRKLVEDSTIKYFYKPFEELSNGKDFVILETLESQLLDRKFDFVIRESKNLISLCSAGLLYYHNYYQKLLLFCISSSYIGWICWLLTSVSSRKNLTILKNTALHTQQKRRLFALNIVFGTFIIMSIILLTVQALPYQYYLYCCLPSVIWWNVLRKFAISHFNFNLLYSDVLVLLGTIVGTELVVISFFERRIISLVMFFVMLWPLSSIKKKISRLYFFLLWTLSCISLMVFPVLPVIGGQPNNIYLIMSTVLWWIFIIISWKFLSRTHFAFPFFNSMNIFAVFFILFGTVLFNVLYVEFTSSINRLSYINQFTSWIVLLSVPFLPLISSRKLVLRLLNIYYSLGIISLLFSVNHDALFLPLFSFHLSLWFLIENIIVSDTSNRPIFNLSFSKLSETALFDNDCLKSSDLRRAFLFIVLSFFGTGNIASINSFDTTWVRCFITVFAPFTMMALILIKIVIPFVATACTFRAVNDVTKVAVDKIFVVVLVYCDIMGLNFLFLVKNVGSWLEIGSSVSHYVISQTIILFLVFLYVLSNYMNCLKFKSFRRGALKFKYFPSKFAD